MNIKNYILPYLALCCIILGCTHEEPEWIPNDPLADFALIHNQETVLPVHPDSLRILAIGNSFTDNSMEYLPLILNNYDNIKNVTLGKITYGGCTLQQHEHFFRKEIPAYWFQIKGPQESRWKQQVPITTMQEALLSCEWDIIILQQASAHSGLYKKYQPYLNRLIEHILSRVTNPNAVIIWHMTWPYSSLCRTKAFRPYGYNPETMYDSIKNAVRKLQEETRIKYVIPSADCISALRNSHINKDKTDFTSDGIHIDNQIGKYALACTWFQSLFCPIYEVTLDSAIVQSLPLSLEEQGNICAIVKDLISDSH